MTGLLRWDSGVVPVIIYDFNAVLVIEVKQCLVIFKVRLKKIVKRKTNFFLNRLFCEDMIFGDGTHLHGIS